MSKAGSSEGNERRRTHLSQLKNWKRKIKICINVNKVGKPLKVNTEHINFKQAGVKLIYSIEGMNEEKKIINKIGNKTVDIFFDAKVTQ